MKSARTTRGFFIVPTYLTVYSRSEEGYILSRPTVDCSFCGRSQGSRVCGRGISPLRRRPKDGARLAALQSPFGNLRPLREQSLAGRGGSVSRRDHNQAYRRRATFEAEPTEKNCRNPNASRSSGKGGLGGEALLSEKRPLPPEAPQHIISSEGSAREGASLRRSTLPRNHLFDYRSLNCATFFFLALARQTTKTIRRTVPM